MTDFFDVVLDGHLVTVEATVYEDGTIECFDRVFEDDEPHGWEEYGYYRWYMEHGAEIEQQIKQQMEVGGWTTAQE